MEETMNNKPQTVSLADLVKIAYRKAKNKRALRRRQRQWRRGMWYCVHCNKMHGKRVIEYQIADGLVDSVCSLGRAELLKYQADLAEDEQYTPGAFRPLLAGQPFQEELTI